MKETEQGVDPNALPAANLILHDHSTINPDVEACPRSGVGWLRRSCEISRTRLTGWCQKLGFMRVVQAFHRPSILNKTMINAPLKII